MAYESIEHLTGLQHVRLRPGMYLGNIELDNDTHGVYHMIKEVIGNSLDEFHNGYGHELSINFDTNLNQIEIVDEGRGIPLGESTEEECSYLHLAVGVLNSGGKYHKGEGQAFKFAIGLNGVGVKCVNALSSEFQVVSVRDGQHRDLLYKLGERETYHDDLQDGGYYVQFCKYHMKHGVYIRYIPDLSILKYKYRDTWIRDLLQELALINPGFQIHYYLDGKHIEDYYVKSISETFKHQLKDAHVILGPIEMEHETEEAKYTVALAITSELDTRIKSFVNGMRISNNSEPVAAFSDTITATLKYYYEHDFNGQLKTYWSDYKFGVTAVLSLFEQEPVFDSQTKNVLISNTLSTLLSEDAGDRLYKALQNNPIAAKELMRIVEVIANERIETARLREKSQKLIKQAKEIKADLEFVDRDFYQPAQITLKQCKESEKDLSILYVSEGRSAQVGVLAALSQINPDTGNTYQQYAGSLAMKGLLTNTLEQTMEQILEYPEVRRFITVLGLNPSDPDDLSGLNYNTLVFATDSDVYGVYFSYFYYLCVLVCHFPAFFRQGRCKYLATPLYRLEHGNTKLFAFSDAERLQLQKENPCLATTARYKGIGELTKDALHFINQPVLQSMDTDLDELLEMYYLFGGDGKKWLEQRRQYLDNILPEEKDYEQIP